MSDIGASVLAKLKNRAIEKGISYQQCLQLFFQEEFLRRLSLSKYKNNFILKGGLFIYTVTNFESRATVDVDFLLRGISNDMNRMDVIIEEILNVPTDNDYIIFKKTPTEPIAEHRKYHGISTQITGCIKNVRVPFGIDIGVGDEIVPYAETRTIRTQLDGFISPEVMTYSLESTIAEKFDAILQRFELTSRMKDFYDIYYLSMKFDFEGEKLLAAMKKTLVTRCTAYDNDSFERIKGLVDDDSIKTKWNFFIKTLKSSNMPFSQVMDGINTFIEPVWEAFINEKEFKHMWNSKGFWE